MEALLKQCGSTTPHIDVIEVFSRSKTGPIINCILSDFPDHMVVATQVLTNALKLEEYLDSKVKRPGRSAWYGK